MLNEIDILRDICGRLDSLQIPYMLTGSMAMNYYAVPRMTRDIDLVIALPSGSVSRLVQALAPNYMIGECLSLGRTNPRLALVKVLKFK